MGVTPGPVTDVRRAPLRVVVADDQLLVREGVRRILEGSGRANVVDEVRDLAGLEAAVRSHDPDVVVTAIRLAPTFTDEGIRFASAVQQLAPGVGVLVLSQQASAAHATALFSGGVSGRGYLLKQRISDGGTLLDALDAVAAGELYLDTGLVRELLATDGAEHAPALTGLTSREREILALMAEGKSNAGIAGNLVVTSRAVERHIGSIFMKLQLSDTPDVSRRVMAVLSYLADEADAAG
jgi:DNA-binding NarL/FixJ family response regulator